MTVAKPFRTPTPRREELRPALQGLLANRPVRDVLGIFERLARALVDPGCYQLPVVSVRRSRLEWGIWTIVRGVEAPGWPPGGEPAGLRRRLDGAMVALFSGPAGR